MGVHCGQLLAQHPIRLEEKGIIGTHYSQDFIRVGVRVRGGMRILTQRPIRFHSLAHFLALAAEHTQ